MSRDLTIEEKKSLYKWAENQFHFYTPFNELQLDELSEVLPIGKVKLYIYERYKIWINAMFDAQINQIEIERTEALARLKSEYKDSV